MQATGLLSIPARLRPTPGAIPTSARRIADGHVVSMHYSLVLESGKVVESTSGQPFQFLQGAGNVVAGLERELMNRRVGDRLSIEVSAEHGYGPVDPALIQRVPRTDFPADAQLTPGMRFGSELEDGTILPARITGADEKELTIDFNHPLAGETLHFVVEIVGIRDARPEEQSRGRPIGPTMALR